LKLSADDVRRLQEWGLHTQSAPKVEDADLLRRLRVEHQRLEVGQGYAETTVTPGMAKQWLTNALPMQLSERQINDYAHLMRTGQWTIHAGSPIRFDNSGRLVDGQHRLHACILADTNFNTPIVHINDAIAWAQVGAKISNIAAQTAERVRGLSGDEVEQEIARALYRALSEHATEHAR